MENKKYIGIAEMSRMLKKELKTKFPKVKFSVRSDSYSMGCSIHVEYTDGPKLEDVDMITQKYSGKGFDGSVDYAYYKSHCLMPDNTLKIIKSEGSACTGGYREGYELDLPEGAVLVDTASPYVFTRREVSEEIIITVCKAIAEDFGFDFVNVWDRPKELGGCQSVGDVAYSVYSKVDLYEFNGVKRVEDDDKHNGSYYSMVVVY